MILSVYINEDAGARMMAIAAETGRSVEDLASAVIESEAGLNYRFRDDDPCTSVYVQEG